MACERYRDALTDVAAGAPAPADVEAHLVSCEGCRQELEALRHALALAAAEMAGLVAAEPSPGLSARIRQAVAESGSAPAWRFGWLWTVTPAAAALLVALAVWVGRAPSPAAAVGGTPVIPGTTGPLIPRERPCRPQGSTSAVPGTVPADPRVGASSSGGQSHRRRPEVLVPRGEAEALVRFAALVHRDRHAPVAFLAAGRPSPDLAEPAALDITPLEIVPLDPAETPGT
jgi:hypothetical protein